MSFLGDHRFLLPATLAVTAALYFGGRRVSALLFFGVVMGGLAPGDPVQAHLPPGAARPLAPLAPEKTYSFPSGHATMSTLFFGAAAALVLHISRNRVLRGAALALATLIVLSVSYTRIYLGVHWTSDVAAGILIGLFWVTVCATGTEYLAAGSRRTG